VATLVNENVAKEARREVATVQSKAKFNFQLFLTALLIDER
jgi:hypothetical protein